MSASLVLSKRSLKKIKIVPTAVENRLLPLFCKSRSRHSGRFSNRHRPDQKCKIQRMPMASLSALTKYMCPIYRVGLRGNPVLLGTAVPVEVSGESFLLSAAHVLDENRDSTLYVFMGEELTPLIAPDSCTNTLPSMGTREDDPIDIACMRLETETRRALDSVCFLKPRQLEVNEVSGAGCAYTFMGYPHAKNGPRWGKQSLRPDPWSYSCPSVPKQDYKKLGYSPRTHVIVPFDKRQVLNADGRIVEAPDMKGMSGGPVWRYSASGVPKVAAIGTDHKRRGKILVGVRMDIFIEVLGCHWPYVRHALPRISGIKMSVRY